MNSFNSFISKFFLPYGHNEIQITLNGKLSKEDLAKIEIIKPFTGNDEKIDLDRELRKALQEPIGSEYKESIFFLLNSKILEFKERIEKNADLNETEENYKRFFTIGIVIDDYTRKTPNQNILKSLLDILDSIRLEPHNEPKSSNANPSNTDLSNMSSINTDLSNMSSINTDLSNTDQFNADSSNTKHIKKLYKIFIAGGTHRPPKPEELESNYFKPIFNRKDVKIIPVSSSSSSKSHNNLQGFYRLVGKTKFGTEVRIFKEYLDCDFKITISDILFHYFAGFGGGRKSIFPGLAYHSGISHNHKMAIMEGVAPAKLLGNPVSEDMEEAANLEGCKPDFSINYVTSMKGDVIKLFCGDLNDAFKSGAMWYKERYSIKIPIKKRADLVILSCGGHPYDINYYQSLKALHHSKNACKHGGTIIFITECPDKIGNGAFSKISEHFSSKEWKKDYDIKEIKKFLQQDFKQGYNSLYFQRKFASDYNIILYSSFKDSNLTETNGMNYIPRSWGIKRALSDNDKNAIEKLSNLIAEEIKKSSGVFVIPEGSKYLITN